MVTTQKISRLGGEFIVNFARAAVARALLVFRALLGRRWSFSAESKFWRHLPTFHSPPKLHSVPGQSPLSDCRWEICWSPGEEFKIGRHLLDFPPGDFFKIGCWPVGDRSGIVGHQSVTAWTRRGEAPPILPSFDLNCTRQEINRVLPGHCWRFTSQSTSPKIVGRCLNSSGAQEGY